MNHRSCPAWVDTLRIMLCGGALVASPIAAHAYLDPGSGSLIFQSLLAVIFGIGVGLRTIRNWLHNKWTALTRRGDSAKNDTAE